MIAASLPVRLIGGSQHRIDLLASQGLDEPPIGSLDGNRHNLSRRTNHLGISQCQPAKERPNGGEPDVARAGTVMSIFLQAVEEGQNHGGIQCFNLESDRLGLQMLFDILKKQAKRVTVTRRRLRTDMLVL